MIALATTTPATRTTVPIARAVSSRVLAARNPSRRATPLITSMRMQKARRAALAPARGLRHLAVLRLRRTREKTTTPTWRRRRPTLLRRATTTALLNSPSRSSSTPTRRRAVTRPISIAASLAKAGGLCCPQEGNSASVPRLAEAPRQQIHLRDYIYLAMCLISSFFRSRTWNLTRTLVSPSVQL